MGQRNSKCRDPEAAVFCMCLTTAGSPGWLETGWTAIVMKLFFGDVPHTHSGLSLSHKKNEIVPLAAARTGLETVTLSEVSEAEKAKYHTMSLICGI